MKQALPLVETNIVSNIKLVEDVSKFNDQYSGRHPNLGIISHDIVNLYPSIPLYDGIARVMNFLLECDNIQWFGISKNLYRQMLTLICFSYEIRFQGEIYLQCVTE